MVGRAEQLKISLSRVVNSDTVSQFIFASVFAKPLFGLLFSDFDSKRRISKPIPTLMMQLYEKYLYLAMIISDN